MIFVKKSIIGFKLFNIQQIDSIYFMPFNIQQFFVDIVNHLGAISRYRASIGLFAFFCWRWVCRRPPRPPPTKVWVLYHRLLSGARPNFLKT